jgi:hypothetical protein
VDFLLLSLDELSILSDNINPTLTYNPISAVSALARQVLHNI